jgi:hypothetical protein
MSGDADIGSGGGGGRGFRAVALALVLSLLVSFLGSTAEAVRGLDVPGRGGDGVPAVLVAGGDALDSFLPPRPVTLETSRPALAVPPVPQAPAMAPVACAVVPPSWRRFSFEETAFVPAPGPGRAGPRSPTGPPAV